jgi:hypothetical protein
MADTVGPQLNRVEGDMQADLRQRMALPIIALPPAAT